jgi:hypothetical protein
MTEKRKNKPVTNPDVEREQPGGLENGPVNR